MVVFPVAKLGFLVIKQIAKPLTQFVVKRSKSNHFFRTNVCIPPAQFYHWCEVKMKMYVMNIGKSGQNATIPKLNEEAAIELGANLLGEGLIFVIAAGILTFEVIRSKDKERQKEEDEQQHLIGLETRIGELEYVNEEFDTKIRELTRLLYSIQHNQDMAKKNNVKNNPENKNTTKQPVINQVISDAASKISKTS